MRILSDNYLVQTIIALYLRPSIELCILCSAISRGGLEESVRALPDSKKRVGKDYYLLLDTGRFNTRAQLFEASKRRYIYNLTNSVRTYCLPFD